VQCGPIAYHGTFGNICMRKYLNAHIPLYACFIVLLYRTHLYQKKLQKGLRYRLIDYNLFLYVKSCDFEIVKGQDFIKKLGFGRLFRDDYCA